MGCWVVYVTPAVEPGVPLKYRTNHLLASFAAMSAPSMPA